MVDIVTGGAGFIGSHLVEALLAKGREVHVIDTRYHPYATKQYPYLNHPNYHYCNWDVSSPQAGFPDIAGKTIDRVFHLAALADIVPSIEKPKEYYNTNVTGTLNVLESARRNGCKKFIYAASASCYGNSPISKVSAYDAREWTIRGWNEIGILDQPEPQYPYALTKYLGEQLVMHWAKVYKIPAISLRLFNVYGPRSRTNGTYGAMFGTFLAQKANGLPLTIVGDGTQSRDFVHVSDVVDAFIKAAECDKHGIYNVGTGKPISVNHIAALIGGERIHIPKRPGEPDVTCADISKIKREMGWEPKVTIEEGVSDLLTHLDEYKDAPLWTPEKIAEATKEWFECLS